MPKLIIDGQQVEVPDGTNVLDAAKKIGVVIPHFCYHPALGPVGACRLCAMNFVEGPIKGIQVSCMVKAQDGMVVTTDDGESAKLRRLVIEWLMMNHPHDCPVCDEGGMCLLQDYTVSGGHGIRRYRGKKRTFSDQYLGEFIQHEMNRCIQCYRCARYYQDYAGGCDFGPLQIANKVYFGRYKDGWLESEFTGNLAEVCPTGVFTDKTYRFKARLWDLETAPSVCPHCSLGCNTIPGARYRELLRITARENQAVNGWFICDRGRFGHGYSSRAERPYQPTVGGKVTSREDALQEAADRLFEALQRHGPAGVAFLLSPRASVETMFSVRKLAEALGVNDVAFSPEPVREKKDRRAACRLSAGLSRPMMELERSDLIILAGADPLNEAPMLALIMRQAARNGARVVVLDPRPLSLPFEFTHIPTPPERLSTSLRETIAREASGSKAPTIIVGTDIGDEALIDAAAEEVARLKGEGKDAGLIYVMAGPNSFGGALMAEDAPGFDHVVEGMAAGRVKALVVFEADPVGLYPDAERLDTGLAKLESLIVFDYLQSGAVKRSDVFIPTTTVAESDGVYVNNEGRAQAFRKAYNAGVPIHMAANESHPPREFHTDIPGHAYPAWQCALELICYLKPECPVTKTVEGLRHELSTSGPLWEAIKGLEPESQGVMLTGATLYKPPEVEGLDEAEGTGLRLIVSEHTFGTEELCSYSEKTNLRAPKPCVLMNADDAARLGLSAGANVTVSHGGMSVELELSTSDKTAPGVAVAPRLPGLPIRAMAGRYVKITA